MAKSIKLPFVPSSLRQVREISGCTVEETSKKVGKDVATIRRWESDEWDELPTLAQAEKLESLYKYPLTLFLQDEVPEYVRVPDVHDFRTVSREGPASQLKWSRNLRWLLRQMEFRQDFVIEVASYWELPYQEWVGSESRDKVNPERLAVKMRELLGVSREEQRSVRNVKDALKMWIQRFEDEAGVFVMQTNNHRSYAIELSEMRGVSLAHNRAPFIALNSKDGEAGRIFTLFHEFAHQWIGASGISGWDGLEFREYVGTDVEMERFCDNVAASALMPREWFTDEWESLRDGDSLDVKIRYLANTFKVSREAVAVRTRRLGRIGWDEYSDWRVEYLKGVRENQMDGAKGSGGNYYATFVRNAGRKYVNLVLGCFFDRYLGIKEATSLLDIKGGNIYPLARHAGFKV